MPKPSELYLWWVEHQCIPLCSIFYIIAHNSLWRTHCGYAVYGRPALHHLGTHWLSDANGPSEWNTRDRQTETFIVPNYLKFLADTSIFAASLSANGFVECTHMSNRWAPILSVWHSVFYWSQHFMNSFVRLYRVSVVLTLNQEGNKML